VGKIGEAVKGIIKNLNTGPNQWMSRVFFGGLVETGKKTDINYKLDELSLFCKIPHWEELLDKNKHGVLMVEEVFKDSIPANFKTNELLMEDIVLSRRLLLKMNDDRTVSSYNPNSEVELKSQIRQVLQKFCRTVTDNKLKIHCLLTAVRAIAAKTPKELYADKDSIKTEVCDPFKAKATPKNCDEIDGLKRKIPLEDTKELKVAEAATKLRREKNKKKKD